MVDWLKASNASLAKLQEVGTKIYNLGIADTSQLKVNKNLKATPNTQTAINNAAGLTKTAWGSNSSIPELLRRQNERQRAQKGTRPVSAKSATHTVRTKIRQRPQSAKELGAGSDKDKKPPTGLGVKGKHRYLETRPPGGIGVGSGAGWAAALPNGVFGMSGKEIDDVLIQVSNSQRRAGSNAAWQHGGDSGAPPPPRGSPDFSEMLNTRNGQGSEFAHLIDDLLFDPHMLPSDIVSRPPPEPIHVTMPRMEMDEGADSPDIDDSESNVIYRRSPRASTSRPTHKNRSMFNINSQFDDYNPWQSVDETDDEEILVEATPAPVREPLRMRTVTFNEERNETTLITPRGAKSKLHCEEEEDEENKMGAESNSEYEQLENHLPRPYHEGYDYGQSQTQLPKPKSYMGRTDLRWVKSRTDSGIPLASQDEGMQSVSRKGSGKGRGTATGAITIASREDKTQSVPATVSVAYFDDLIPDGESESAPKDSKSKMTRKSHLRDDVETMVSKIALEEDPAIELQVNKIGSKGDVQWATPESITTKMVSGNQKNYYELALQAKMVEHRCQQQIKEDESKTMKTIKTLEFGDGEVTEHKSVCTVDNLQHQKKDYVIPKDARPQSALKSKVTDSGSESSENKLQSKSQNITDSESHTQGIGEGDLGLHGLSPRSKLHGPSPRSNLQGPSSRSNLHGQSPRSNLQLGPSSKSNLQHESSPASNRQTVLSSRSNLQHGPSPRSNLQYGPSPRSNIQHGPSPRDNLRAGSNSNSQMSDSSRGSRTSPSNSGDCTASRPSPWLAVGNRVEKSSAKEAKREATTKIKTSAEFQNVRLKKQRAASAPAWQGPTFENGKLSIGGARIGIMSNSPYAAPVQKPRPYTASAVSDMKKRPTSAHLKISTKLSYKEIQRVKAAAKLVKKGTLGHPRTYNMERFYANYTRPPPPKTIIPVLRKKKAAMAEAAASAVGEKETKESSVVQMWTRQDDFEVETEGIAECKKIQDRLLEQGVPVTLDTLTRALLPPGECALRGATYVTSTNPTLPEDTSRLLSKPAIWFPEEFNRLQRARKLAQRAEQSLKDQDWDDRNRIYMTSGISVNSTEKKKTKKKKKKKKKEIDSRSSSGI